MQDTLPEGTARAAQLAPSAVTASAVGGSATCTRSVVADSPPTTSGSSTPRDRTSNIWIMTVTLEVSQLDMSALKLYMV